jgi:regulator of replication initiation timing
MDDAYKDMYVTVDKQKYRSLVRQRDDLVSENSRLRDENKRLNNRVSELHWRVYPDRMGR